MQKLYLTSRLLLRDFQKYLNLARVDTRSDLLVLRTDNRLTVFILHFVKFL
jgi:hypothetical protein